MAGFWWLRLWRRVSMLSRGRRTRPQPHRRYVFQVEPLEPRWLPSIVYLVLPPFPEDTSISASVSQGPGVTYDINGVTPPAHFADFVFSNDGAFTYAPA